MNVVPHQLCDRGGWQTTLCPSLASREQSSWCVPRAHSGAVKAQEGDPAAVF